MERLYIDQLENFVGKEVTFFGWVDIRRDHGKLIFIDIRDITGKIQAVALPNHEEAHKIAQTIRPEWIIEATGIINQRPEKMVKDGINGKIELEITNIKIVSEAKTPPFEINSDTADIEEEVRLKYRYLDLRTERMQRNLKLRASWMESCRQYLLKNRFNEIETPILTESTPEGSRDFIVPSRMQKGKFYALPQAPQQYKQLLMVSGMDRYFQMAKCFRDEDPRSDRGFEFTQIDIEASFVTQEDLMNLIEGMVIKAGEDNGFKIKEKPFPRFSYKEAIEKFGADKFDLRTEEDKKNKILAYAWVIEFPFFEKDENGNWTFTHNPFSMPRADSLEDHLAGRNIENIMTQQYDLVCNGAEIGGGSIRSHKPEILKATYKIMGNSEEEIEKKVGHMLKAFEYGTPPHGGIALGVERNIMNFTGDTAIREVQAFPTTRTGKTSIMDGPSELDDKQLKDLGLKLLKKEKDE